jgi:hypothetical protein
VVVNSQTAPVEDTLAQPRATTTVGVHLHGATPLLVVLLGAVPHLEGAHLAGEAVVVAEPPVGVEMEDVLRMAAATEAGLLTVVTAHELPMEALLHMVEQLPTVEEQPTVATMVTALPMVASTPEAGHLVGEVQLVTQLPSQASLLPRPAPTTLLHQALMRHQLLAATELTLHLHPAVQWMHQRQATSLRRRRATAGTELHLLRHPHQAHGILRRQRLVARILATTRRGEIV